VQQGMGGPVLCPRKSLSHSLTQGQTSPDRKENVLQQKWRQEYFCHHTTLEHVQKIINMVFRFI